MGTTRWLSRGSVVRWKSESVAPATPYANRGHNFYLPIPYAKHLEDAALPQPEKIVAAARALFGDGS